MNKKFSTLMAGLLLAGGMFSVDAANITLDAVKQETALESAPAATTPVFFTMEYDGATYAYGVSLNADGSIKQDVNKVGAESIDDANIDQYLWYVETHEFKTLGSSDVQYVYALKNKATGKYLSFTDNGEVALVDSYDDDKAGTYVVLSGFDKFSEDAALIAGNYAKLADSKYYLQLDNSLDKLVLSASSTFDFNFYESQASEVDDDTLNKLYNTAGFNFKLADTYKDVANIFNDQRIKAIKVEENEAVKGSDKDKSDYKFPAGTYFVTETPAGSFEGLSATEKYNYLLNCTFIAVSPSDNKSGKADLQKAGEGFALTTVQGKDLNTYVGTDAALVVKGKTISAHNAAFTVKTNFATANEEYSLLLDEFYYLADATKDEQTSEAVRLGLKSNGSYGSTTYLVSEVSTDPSYIFTFVESNVVEGKTFLNENGAAIYNIQFVGGAADGMYLTSAYSGTTPTNSIKNFAKGIAIADLNTPAFQYVITKVDDNDVTFTNRETGESFTAKLFTEDGTDTYSLALADGSETDDYTVLSIDNKGNINPVADASNLGLNQVWVKLTKVASVDKFAGFLNVEDEAKMTLTFARDLDPTSNKIYPVVDENNDLANKMTDKVEEAAQWQLLKSETPSYETYSYAYLSSDEKVAYKAEGDTVAYYTYKFQYINDGIAEDLYIADAENYKFKLADEPSTFVVFENTDGSYNIKLSYESSAAMTSSTSDVDKPGTVIRKEISQAIAATDIKTYLVQDAPEVSLSADASYVTLKSELGNYVAMTGERDGIIVNNDPVTFRVFATDLKSVVPSFYVTTGWNAEDGSRMFLFNPADSVDYYVGAGTYDKEYQWAENTTKAIFKSGVLNASLDTLSTSILGKTTNVAMKADNSGVKGGLDYFKYQIILADAAEADDLYIIRTLADVKDGYRYLYSINDKLCWTNTRSQALKFYIDNVEAPTANEAISAGNVVVAGTNGAVVVKGAEGKNVIVSTILGKVVANEVVSSDNAQIATPAGIVVVSVDGESFKVVVK